MTKAGRDAHVTAAGRLRRSEPVMGTVATVELDDPVRRTSADGSPTRSSPGCARSTGGSAPTGRTARSTGWTGAS